MKTIGVFIIAFMSVLSLHAQKNYLGFSMGVSLPGGAYAKKGLGKGGYAGSGFALAFDGGCFFGKIGLTGSASYGMNYLDDQSLKNDILDHIGYLFPENTWSPDAMIEFTSTQWTYVNFMTGPVLSIPLSVFSFEFRALGGMSFVMPPKRELFIFSSDEQWSGNASGQSVGLGYQIGGGVLFHPSSVYGIRLGVDYLQTRTRYDVHYSYQDPITDKTFLEQADFPVSLIHASFGILYYF